MDQTMKLSAVNKAEAGTCLLKESDEVNCVCMVLKGKAAADAGGSYITLGAGSFLGVNDLASGRYQCDYIALEEVTYYAFPAKSFRDLKQILSANKDYSGLMVWSCSRQTVEMSKLFEDMSEQNAELFQYLNETYAQYQEYCTKAGIKAKSYQLLNDMRPFAVSRVPEPGLIKYYKEAARITLEKNKEFFSEAQSMAQRHIEEEAELINTLQQACKEAADYLENLFYLMMNKGNESLFLMISELLILLTNQKKDMGDFSGLLDVLIDKINEMDAYFADHVGRNLFVDRERMEEIYHAVISGSSLDEVVSVKDEAKGREINAEELAQIKRTLQGSLQQIVQFSEWEEEKSEKFVRAVEAFVQLPDRMSTTDVVRKLKKEIASLFFDLYQEVLLHSVGKERLPLVIELFLDFFYVDERLVTDETLAQLCSLPKEEQSEPCRVYTLREWLTLVYEGKRIPSKSEFDLDYDESLRDMRKRGVISEEEMKSSAKDRKKWLEFEIHNMMACNCRLLNGQISTYVPILFSEGLAWEPAKSVLSRKAVNECLGRVMQSDPNVFYREILYMNPGAGIEREYVMKQVFPEIILFPVNGINTIMWQEITGKRRDSEGRFLIPRFYEGRPEDAMVRMLGRFRWELCRSIQGTAWNNIQVKSLTSEYCDYLQYYRKNHELSEEKKEKLKLQIQRAKGNTREAFIQDYDIWVRYEAKGAIRMNKVAREILATYCPFPKIMRKQLIEQPIFEDAMGRFERNLSKKIYELDMHYRNLEKEKGPLTEELLATMEYYKNL